MKAFSHAVKRHRKALLWAAWILTAVAVVLCAWRIYSLNRRFPNPVIIRHTIGEVIPAGDISLEFIGLELTGGVEFKKAYPNYEDTTRNPNASALRDEQKYVLTAAVRVRNLTREAKIISLARIYGESLSWANGIDADIFGLMNPGFRDPMRVELQAGESLELVLPYSLYDFQFSPKDWENIENRGFDLVLSYYPQRNIVEAPPAQSAEGG